MTSNEELEERIEAMAGILIPRLENGGQRFSLEKEDIDIGRNSNLRIAYLLGEAGAIVLVAKRYNGKEHSLAEKHIIKQYQFYETHLGQSLGIIFHKDRKDAFRHISQDKIPREKFWKAHLFSGSPVIKDKIDTLNLSDKEKVRYFKKIQGNTWNKTIALSQYESNNRLRNAKIAGEYIIQYVQVESPRREEAILNYQFNETMLKKGKSVYGPNRKNIPETYGIITSNAQNLGDIVQLKDGLLIPAK